MCLFKAELWCGMTFLGLSGCAKDSTFNENNHEKWESFSKLGRKEGTDVVVVKPL